MLSAKPWRTEAVFLFIAAQAFMLLLGGIAMGLLQKTGLPGFKDADDLGNLLIGTLCFQGVTWILMFIFFRYHHVNWVDELGLKKKKWLLSLLLAFVAVSLVLIMASWLENLSVDLMEKFHWKPVDETAVALLAGAKTLPARIYLAFFAVVLAPVAEEFIFRGLLFPFLKQHGFPKLAWVGVNLLFALIHADAAIFLPILVLSFVLTWLYEVTDNLLAPIFAHALFNAANLAILLWQMK